MCEEIKQELKLSKKQNKNDRYNYLCSQFNGIEYAMKLENYIKKLQQENTILKQQLKYKDEKISKVKEYITSYESISIIQNLENAKENIKLDEKTTIEMCRRYLIVHDKILEILESNKED